MLRVYRYRAWDEMLSAWLIYPVKSTPERIAAMGGIVVPGTGEYIEPAKLDESGVYHMPRRTGRASEQPVAA
jgi:hypothetical protein